MELIVLVFLSSGLFLGWSLGSNAGIVAKLAPIGVFALMAHAAGTTDVADLVRLQVYISFSIH